MSDSEHKLKPAEYDETVIRYSCIHRIITTLMVVVLVMFFQWYFPLETRMFIPFTIAFLLMNLVPLIFNPPAIDKINTFLRITHILYITYVIYLFGGIHSNGFTIGYVIVIFYTGIFYGRRTAAVTTAVSLVCYLSLIILQYNGVLNPSLAFINAEELDGMFLSDQATFIDTPALRPGFYVFHGIVNVMIILMGAYLSIAIIETLKKKKEDTSGKSERIVENMREQTGRLKRTETYFTKLINNVREFSVISVDRFGTILSFNEGSKGIFGWNPAEVEGADISVLTENKDREAIQKLLRRADKLFSENRKIDQISETHFKLAKKDGSPFLGELSISPLMIEDEQPGFIVIIHDISSKEDISRKLKKSELRYQGFIEALKDSLFILDADGRFSWANQFFIDLSGYEINELVTIKPGSIFVFSDNPEKAFKSDISWASEMYLVHKSGKHIPISINMSMLSEGDENRGAVGVLKDLSKTKERDEYIENYTRQLRESRTELERMNSQLIQQQKELKKSKERLEELDKTKNIFLANLSHELKTPLIAGMGYIDLVLNGDTGQVSRDTINFLQISYKNLKKLGLMIDNLLTLSKYAEEARSPETSIINLKDSINSWISDEIQEGKITVDIQIQDSLALIRGDEFLLSTVFSNLIYFSKEKAFNATEVTISAAPRQNQMLEVNYTDHSLLLSRSQIEHLFDSFLDSDLATDKRGIMGIGLSIVQNIIELHGGELRVKSKEGQGTSFLFTLPRHM